MALDKFKQVLQARLKQAQSIKNKVVKVGVVEHQHYDDDTPVAFVASVHEYGTHDEHIKPRPFFRPTIAENKSDWENTIIRAIVNGGNGEQILETVGMIAAGQVQKTIASIDSPRLATSTLIARNRKRHKNGRKPKAISIKPLEDSGLMMASITYKVADKGDE